MDPLSIVEDEVALEGLDGITIPTLWIRLQDRQPKFPLKLDDSTKGLIWRSLVNNTELRFYELPHEREDVELFERFGDIDPETGIETKERSLDQPKDVYPVHVIPENKNSIQGSCAFFKERKDVTKQICSTSLTPLINVEEAIEKYGRKLVVVASQAQRFRALVGIETDPDIKLSSDTYCILERVGRARWQGELQRDLHGGPFKADARKFHYLRKPLVKHDLVTMQAYIRRTKTGQQQHCILLLLKRFHVNRRSICDMMMEYVSKFLQQQPGQICTVAALRKHLNLSDGVYRRLFKSMRLARLTELCRYPLEDLDPSAGPCTNKNGRKVSVRCWKLLKPYVKKGVTDDDEDDDDEDEEDNPRAGTALPSEGRIMEKDVLSQAYHTILSSGTKGVPQRSISLQMNIGKLESRMLWRRLEREGFIKGFMEDEGRQRTTKFISHKFVGASDQLQLFAKEQERNKLLYSSSPGVSGADPSTSKTPPSSKLPANKSRKTSAAKKQNRKKDAEAEQQMCDDGGEDVGDEGLGGKKNKERGKMTRGRKMLEENDSETKNQIQLDVPVVQPTPAENETPACSGSVTSPAPDSVSIPATDQAPVKEEEQSNSTSASTLPQSEVLNTADSSPNVLVVDSALQLPQSQQLQHRSHDTYRLLKRKNLIVEAVQKSKIIDGLIPLQKMINDEEKQDGFSSKCCKKTILRLVHSLSREGLLKLYTTTVIQDGITKKVDMVVHPSIQPNDERVSQLLEQIRFKISSSFSVVRQQQTEEKAKEQKTSMNLRSLVTVGGEDDADFKPTKVPGLGKTLGFQPKMLRLRIIHNFLWYLNYGHPLRGNSAGTGSARETPTDPSGSNTNAKNPDCQAKQDLKEKESSGVSNLDVTSGDEEELLNDKSKPDDSKSDMKVYADEDSWRRFVPPVRVQKDRTNGWAMVGDMLLCLPLSIFMQVTRINYQVDGLKEYLSDPVKQHYLVRSLPAKMKRRLLYKRKYIHAFHENFQKLTYMGLLQFGLAEKFKEKDQVFVYLKRKATIVDTTNADPHYWLVTESPDNPFERRQYTFNTADDVESYWFDMMCVCLNTPLGVIRSKRNATEDEAPSFIRPERALFLGLAHLRKGSNEVCDDGSIPGDGKGAGGLDSEFFGHLKRNWLWTSHLLAFKTRPSGSESPQTQIRLKNLLGKNALRMALQAGGTTSPHYLTMKRPHVAENVKVETEPASRNQQVVGGKGQKRKRSKKEVVKVSRKKKKEPKKRTGSHDEADHRALKMMTKQRVYWSVQEDSLMLLCSVACYLLNSKLKRPFIPHCVVRDLLHAEFEMSVDKTSLAVGRRTRYILRNPHSLLNYRICLAEVYQDKTLMRMLEEEQPADPNKPEDCAKVFSEYVRLLRQKFISVINTYDVIVPDSKEQLFSKFKVSAIDDGKQFPCKDTIRSADDIHAIVLHNLIQSTLAMTNNQMKSSRSFQTFHMYSKYDQELLCRVFIQCRKRRLVNRRRVSHSFGPKKNRALPILPMSYQLSQSYFRCFAWRFPRSLCTDSFCFLRSLITAGTGDERPFTTFYNETEVRSQNGEEVSEGKADSARKKKQSGGKEDCRQVSEPQIQPEVVNIDSTKEGDNSQSQMEEKNLMESDVNNEKTEEMSKSEQHENPETSLTSGSVDVSPSKEQPDKHIPEVSEVSPDLSGMMRFFLNSPGGACVVSLSLMSLGMLSIHLSIPKQIVVVDSNLVDNDVTKSMAVLEEDDDDEDGGEECEGRKRLHVTSHQASHTNYLMMRGYCSPGIVKLRNSSSTDNIVVESCNMSLQLRNTPAHHVFSEENSPPLAFTKCGPSLLPPIMTSYIRSPFSSPPSVEVCDRLFIQQRGYTTLDIEVCAQLRRSLDEAGVTGLDERELFKAHVHLQVPESGRTRSLQQYLKDLQEELQVVRVGSLGVRWVLMQHAEPWLLTINAKKSPCSNLTSRRAPSLGSLHNIPFVRKRSSKEVRLEKVEPPAKTLALDGGEGPDREPVDGSSCSATEKPNEEEHQKERADEGSGDKLLNVEEEGRVQTLSKEEGEKGQVDTEKIHHNKRELRTRRSSVNNERHEDEHSPTRPLADDEENSSFVSRPWRLVDGKLNRSVCKGMLEAILFHIMSLPGLTQQSLVKHYKDLLQPVAVLDLVQALIDLGCVTKKILVKEPKPSLFARSVHQRKSEAIVNVEEPDTVFYEPTISCCLRLCQVLPNERHWNDCVS